MYSGQSPNMLVGPGVESRVQLAAVLLFVCWKDENAASLEKVLQI